MIVWKLFNMSKRHTISINDDEYIRLKQCGRFGESYGELISRLVNFVETSNQSDAGRQDSQK
jgi:predicted CopG family antitoxin